MRLNINGDLEIKNPNEKNLDEYIETLGVDEFIILSDEDEYYIQSYMDKNPAESVIEYREGSADKHFSAPIISKDKVLEAFKLFLHGNEDFKKIHQWKILTIDENQYLDED